MPGRTLQGGAAALKEQVSLLLPKILEQAQITTANHQKNLVALYKLQTEASLCTEKVRKGRGLKLVGEKIFEEAMFQIMTRVLPVKKGVVQADRVVKFVGQYIKFINEKGESFSSRFAISNFFAAAEERNAEEAVEDDDDDTTASRFTARLLRFLFKGFLSKDKSVRFRVLQMVAEMVSHLGEIDEDIYSELRSSLMDRVNDKEATVRVQAVIALSKLSGSEDPSELDEGERTVLEVLLDILEHDSSADVRRAVILNIPVNPTTLLAILARTRDTDTTLRKVVYSAILEANVTVEDTEEMGPTHPRAFTIAQRELIIRNGLGDREPSVRAAAASLLGRWVDAVGERVPKEEGEEKPEVNVESGLVELLKMLDLTEQEYPVDAVLSVFTSRPHIFDTMEFGSAYWANLTPETTFLARVFVDHGRATNDNARLEAVLPVVTEVAFRIQKVYNDLDDEITAEDEERLLGSLSEDDKARYEDARLEKEAIIGELLQLALNLDYSDEIGRRKMFQLVRDMLSKEVFPQSLLNKGLDVLRKLSDSERDLIRVAVEIVQDLRDTTRDDEDEEEPADPNATPATVLPPRKPPREKTAEEKKHSDAIDLRCLLLCIGMLERVNGTLDENSTLHGILQDLIIPSVKRKEFIFREKGLISLGLCCLISKQLAMNSIGLFLGQIQSSPDTLQTSLLQVAFDVLMVHDADFRKDLPEAFPKAMKLLLSLLGSDTSDKVRALVCMGLSKLILAGMAADDEPIINLIQIYFSPVTVDNQELRQCLTFFFQVFSYSSPTNQETISRIFLRTYKALKKDRESLEDDEDMVSPAQIAGHFVDWTDPNRLRHAEQANMSVQLDLTIDIVKTLLEENWEKDDKKVFCQLLGKLHIPDSADGDKVKGLKVLMNALRSRRPIHDTTTNNAFTKFEAAVTKKFEKQLEDFSEEEYRKLEQLENLFEFLDSIVPDDDEEEINLDEPKRKGKKRRSESIVTATTEGEDSAFVGSSKRRRSKPRSKRSRLSKSDDESDDDDIAELTTPPPPTRKVPKRLAATKQLPEAIYISSEDDEYTPATRSKQKSSTRVKEEEEEELDAELDAMPDTSFDSIVDDSHEQEEEEEVNDLLAEE